MFLLVRLKRLKVTSTPWWRSSISVCLTPKAPESSSDWHQSPLLIWRKKPWGFNFASCCISGHKNQRRPLSILCSKYRNHSKCSVWVTAWSVSTPKCLRKTRPWGKHVPPESNRASEWASSRSRLPISESLPERRWHISTLGLMVFLQAGLTAWCDGLYVALTGNTHGSAVLSPSQIRKEEWEEWESHLRGWGLVHTWLGTKNEYPPSFFFKNTFIHTSSFATKIIHM